MCRKQKDILLTLTIEDCLISHLTNFQKNLQMLPEDASIKEEALALKEF